MKNTLIIDARQSGKTTNLIKTFANNIQANPFSVIVTPTNMMFDTFTHKFGVNKEWLSVSCPLMPKKGTYVYVDEYFMLDIKRRKTIFNLALNGKIVVYANGTPVKAYNRRDVDIVRAWWKYSTDSNFIFGHSILKSEDTMVKLYGEDLVFNLLVLPEIYIDEPTLNRSKIVSNPQFDIMGDIWE